MDPGHQFPTGQYGAEEQFGGYGDEYYSGVAHDGSGFLGPGTSQLVQAFGYGTGQHSQQPNHPFDGQHFSDKGEELNDGSNGGDWNPGDGQDAAEWDGEFHLDPEGGAHHFSECDYHHDQQGNYHYMAQAGNQQGAQAAYQHNPHTGIHPGTQNVVHHVVHHVAEDGYHNDSQGGQGWDNEYQDDQQDGQEWDDGFDQSGGDFDLGQRFGQPLDHDSPGLSSIDKHSGHDVHSSSPNAPPGNAVVPFSTQSQGGEQHAPPTSAQSLGGVNGFHIELKNTTSSSNVYAYVTGQALDHGNALFILGSDGKTPHFPPSPPGPNAPLSEDCGIDLGYPGNTVSIAIPHIAGGRIWFSIDAPLQFSLNPGPALMEPSITNESNPNFSTNWGFCELTFSPEQLYANISYVDFVSIPISLELTTEHGTTQAVSGMAPDGLDEVCEALQTQHAVDGKGWDQLIVTHNGKNLRALSPNQGIVGKSDLFADYYDEYIDQVWDRLSKELISVDTQAAAGTVSAHVANGVLNVGGGTLSKPSTHDIFTCSTGPFQTGSNGEMNAIIPRIGAAFNRSTLLTSLEFPEPPSEHYKELVTNHYSRIVHMANLDGKGYAFPYDDVQQTGGPDQSGEVHASDPKVLTVAVGGSDGASAHQQDHSW